MDLERSEHIRPLRVVNPRAAEFIQVLPRLRPCVPLNNSTTKTKKALHSPGAPVLALVGGDGSPMGPRPRQKTHGS